MDHMMPDHKKVTNKEDPIEEDPKEELGKDEEDPTKVDVISKSMNLNTTWVGSQNSISNLINTLFAIIFINAIKNPRCLKTL